MATGVAKRLINVEEYYKMAEVGILKPTDRVELINGEIFEMSPIGSSHAAIVNKLANLFYGLFKNRAVIGIQNPIRIDGNNEPEPDIALLKYRSDYYASAHPAPADVLAIIEVAGSSVRFEKEVKSPLYAAHGIPEYWIIDLDSDRIEVFSNPKGGAYAEPEVYRSGDEVTLMGSKLFVNDLII